MVSAEQWEQANRPIGEVLDGLSIHPLDEGDRAVAAFVVIKTVDAEGAQDWVTRRTDLDYPNDEELLGVLTVQCELARRDALASWVDDGEE
jgi:hypothetical protein